EIDGSNLSRRELDLEPVAVTGEIDLAAGRSAGRELAERVARIAEAAGEIVGEGEAEAIAARADILGRAGFSIVGAARRGGEAQLRIGLTGHGIVVLRDLGAG